MLKALVIMILALACLRNLHQRFHLSTNGGEVVVLDPSLGEVRCAEELVGRASRRVTRVDVSSEDHEEDHDFGHVHGVGRVPAGDVQSRLSVRIYVFGPGSYAQELEDLPHLALADRDVQESLPFFRLLIDVVGVRVVVVECDAVLSGVSPIHRIVWPARNICQPLREQDLVDLDLVRPQKGHFYAPMFQVL